MTTIVKRKTKTVYCIIHEVKTWFEDFVDEDNGEVVSIERHQVLNTYIAILTDVPFIDIKREQVDFIKTYIRTIYKNCVVDSLITPLKFGKIDRGEIKKYKHIKRIEL